MRITNSSSIFGKIALAIVFASMIGGSYITPVFGKDDDDRRRQGQQYQQHKQQYQYQHGRYVHGRYVPNPYYYPQRVYAPPPVVYYPEPSPGISLVFPIIIR